MEFHLEELFSAPGGWESARIFLLAAVAFGILAGVELVTDSATGLTVILAVGMGIAGIAELLPTHRQRLAGVLRIMAIATLSTVLVVALVRLLS